MPGRILFAFIGVIRGQNEAGYLTIWVNSGKVDTTSNWEPMLMTARPERRELQFNNLDEVVAEAERLASGQVRTTGRHSFGQILEHLARSHDMTTGKLQVPPPPWYMRLMIPLMKPMLLNDKPLKPGFKLPKQSEAVFWPDQEFDVATALAHLKESIAHYQTQGPLPKHPMFGSITRQQNDQLICRHAALHLGFVHPAS
jgi:hypothetical protein